MPRAVEASSQTLDLLALTAPRAGTDRLSEQLKNLGIRRFAFVRRILLVLGRRLHEQGSLSCRDDIFFLEISELEPVATGDASFDWRERIESRRREYEKNLKLNPPRVVNGRFDPKRAKLAGGERGRETSGRHSGFSRHGHRACPRDFARG